MYYSFVYISMFWMNGYYTCAKRLSTVWLNRKENTSDLPSKWPQCIASRKNHLAWQFSLQYGELFSCLKLNCVEFPVILISFSASTEHVHFVVSSVNKPAHLDRTGTVLILIFCAVHEQLCYCPTRGGNFNGRFLNRNSVLVWCLYFWTWVFCFLNRHVAQLRQLRRNHLSMSKTIRLAKEMLQSLGYEQTTFLCAIHEFLLFICWGCQLTIWLVLTASNLRTNQSISLQCAWWLPDYPHLSSANNLQEASSIGVSLPEIPV